jgi:hypothetical protein
MKMKLLKITLAVTAMFTLATKAIQAGLAPNPVIVFTEESSTVLTATLGGADFGSVTLDSANRWTWLLPPDRPPLGHATEENNPFEFWLDPESKGAKILGNQVSPAFAFTANGAVIGGIFIVSDFDFSTGNIPIPNGTTSLDKITFSYEDGTSETFGVQFNDLGDSSVPEASSTFRMLFLSGAVMFGATKIRRVRTV